MSRTSVRLQIAAGRSHRGFTLIELMITVAIIGILAAIAIPSYQAYLIKGRRASAQAFLSNVAQAQQQYLLDARSYAPDVATLRITVPTDVSTFYQITIVPLPGPPPSFVATAQPQGPQIPDGALSINNVGVKTSTNNTW